MGEIEQLKSQAWFVEGRTGATESYATLLASIRSPLAVRQLCQPASNRDSLSEFVRAAAAGGRLTLIDQSLTADELGHLGIDGAVVNQSSPHPLRVEVAAFPQWLGAERNPDFVVALFTSGSTGLPTRVEHTLATLGRAVRISSRHAADVWALAYPATHVAGVQVALQALLNGNTLVDLTQLRGAEAAEAIVRHRVTHISATPTYYRLLTAAKRIMPDVRAVTLGGEPADAALLAALHEAFPQARVRNVYASTEAGTVLESDGELFAVPEAIAERVRIADGRLLLHRSLLGKVALPPGNGELLMDDGGKAAKAPGNGEWRMGNGFNSQSPLTNSQSLLSNNKSPITAAAGAAAWFDTGDCVEIVPGEPLRFKIIGRRKEWVNVGGDKVNPREVEAVLRSHPAVQDAAVFGRANSVMGQILVAEVVLKAAEPPGNGEGSTENGSNSQSPLTNPHSPISAPQFCEAQLRVWLGEHLQPFKVPRIIRFVPSLRSTYSGKVKR